MKLFGRGKAKTQQEKVSVKPSPSISKIKSICQELGKPELESMTSFLYLDSSRIRAPLETVVSEAQEFERKGNLLRAEIGYRIAGMYSLFLEASQNPTNSSLLFERYFKDAQRTSTYSHKYDVVVGDPRGSLEVARRYYKEMEKKETEERNLTERAKVQR